MMVMMVDSVLMSAITALNIDLPAWLAQFEPSLLRSNVSKRPFAEMKRSYERSVDVFDMLSLSETIITDANGARTMTTARMMLGDDAEYHSDIAPEGVSNMGDWHFPATDAKSAHIRLKRDRLPETVLMGLIGEHISRVVAHPFLAHPDMIVDGIDHGTEGGRPTIEIGLTQVLIPMEMPT